MGSLQMESVACSFPPGEDGQGRLVCATKPVPEAVGTKVTPGTLTWVLQLAFHGNETCTCCCCASEAETECMQLEEQISRQIWKYSWVVIGTVPEVCEAEEEENMH